MATYKVYVDGVYTTFTAAEYEAEFGYKPTDPSAENRGRLWGGRYEHRTFATADSNQVNGEEGVMQNSGNSLTSSIAD